eukprot:CAMPEP_0168336658 /NCGR_PEP_ID=MMETSP0213-20121227/11686_1 /TAXON_ID=151035 /ORGANISM="Euplotes harpa, Strain FSP1.4" /LENGTH=128 /DNA_ID=CAMNT_0008341919 /DNA_START=17 /DNA_END=403 /DNA_ORIENTATION=+
MKSFIFFVVLIAFFTTVNTKVHDYNELVTELRKPAIEVTVAQLLGGFRKEDVVATVGSKAYDIARTGVGCGAGVFGGADTAFTIADIISQDPKDPGAYIFAVLYTIAWWQQNGQYVTYMCSTFWQLLH